nr:hypothetical protein [Tanacetum cinerariifolium]
APILSTKEPENSLSMGYEHLSITPETESDKVTESNAKNILPILSECEESPLIPRPPPEPHDVETDTGEEILVVMNDKDEDVYSSFIFVIYPEMFPLLLSAESEDTIFDPGLSPED